MPVLKTDRLLLRGWSDGDLDGFAALNADPVVMKQFPATYSRTETSALIKESRRIAAKDGFHCQPIIERRSGAFVGMVGLARVTYSLDFTPAVEIGWRLSQDYWGNGYASEAAEAWLDYGFNCMELSEIVAYTSRGNTASVALMQRLGMKRDLGGDFLHPNLSPDHDLAPHVLYRIPRPTHAA